jgi:hypothetical protein
MAKHKDDTKTPSAPLEKGAFKDAVTGIALASTVAAAGIAHDKGNADRAGDMKPPTYQSSGRIESFIPAGTTTKLKEKLSTAKARLDGKAPKNTVQKSDSCSKCSFMHKAEEKCLKWDHPNGKSLASVKKLLSKDDEKIKKSEFSVEEAKSQLAEIKTRLENKDATPTLNKGDVKRTGLSFNQLKKADDTSPGQFICPACEKVHPAHKGEYVKVKDLLRDDPKTLAHAKKNLDKNAEVMTCLDCAKATKHGIQ